MTVSTDNYILVNSTQAPYSRSNANDAFEAALGASNIGIKVKLVFSGLGQYQLISNQQADKIKRKNILKRISSLPLFDVEDIYLLASTVATEQLDLDMFDVKLIEPPRFSALLHNAKQVLVF